MRGRYGVLAGLVLVSSPVRAESPRELRELGLAVRNAAVRLRVSAPMCAPVAPEVEPPPQNLEAEVIHEASGAMLGALVLKLHPPASGLESVPERTGRIEQLADLLNLAIAAYRTAYTCRPGTAGARHLEAALALVAEFERGLREREKVPDGDPQYAKLQEIVTALRQELPPSLACPLPPPCPKRGECPPPQMDTSYLGKAYGRVFVRAEVGIGWGKLEYSYHAKNDGGVQQYKESTSKIVGPALRLSLGLRQLVGARDRVVLLLGGFYSFQHFTSIKTITGDLSGGLSSSVYRMIHAGGLTAEFGIRFSEGVVSLHPGLEFGVQAYLSDETFGHLRLGGTLGLCFANEIFCIMPRLHTGLQTTRGRTYTGGQIGVGFDLFRAFDRRAINKATAP